MRILITGGAGFLGLHLAKYYAKNVGTGRDLSLLDIAPFNKSEYPKNCVFIQGDIRDKNLINQLIKSVDLVIHAAAALPLWRPEEIFDINVNGTKNLLEAASKNKIKRFVFISSTAVYGIPEKHPIFEDDPLIGVGPYGESKIQAERLCEKYRKMGLIVTIIRPKTFVGTHRLGVFEILFDWIKDGKRIPTIGSGNNRYQLLDVDDLVEAIYLCLTNKNAQKINKTFNIGAEKFGTVREDLEELFEYAQATGGAGACLPDRQGRAPDSAHPPAGGEHWREGNPRQAPSPRKKSTILPTPAFLVKKALWLFEKMKISPLYQWVYDTADHDSYVSINRLIDTLNWHPKYSNSEALIKSYQWYLNNYKQIKSKIPGVTHTVGWDQGILKFFKKFL